MTKSIDAWLTHQSASLVPAVHSYIQTRRRWKANGIGTNIFTEEFLKNIIMGFELWTEQKLQFTFRFDWWKPKCSLAVWCVPWSQRFFLSRKTAAKRRSREAKRREENNLLVNLDLNLTFMQTPAVKRVKLIISKGTNGNLAITRPSVLPVKRTNHIAIRAWGSGPDPGVCMKLRFKSKSSSRRFGTRLHRFAAQEKPLGPGYMTLHVLYLELTIIVNC